METRQPERPNPFEGLEPASVHRWTNHPRPEIDWEKDPIGRLVIKLREALNPLNPSRILGPIRGRIDQFISDCEFFWNFDSHPER